MPTLLRSVRIRQPAVIRPLRQAVEPALLYILLCIPYILYSGRLAARAASTPEQLQLIETIKGVAFILVTGVFFGLISYVRWTRIRRQQETIALQEKSLLQAEGRLVAAMSAATVAHDVNNLLMSLYGLVEGLRGREGHDSGLRTMREQIEVFIEKLTHLAKRLTLAAGRAMPEQAEAVELRGALHELVFVVQKHPDARFCSLATPELTPLTLVLHRALFEEAVMNLLINAAQAAGPSGHIELRLTTEPGAAVLAVHDSGPGVPDELVSDIFEPCFTTKPHGTGIGLLAVRAFAASCGAELSVGRSPLGGALFQLRIPIPPPPTSKGADPCPAPCVQAG